MCDGKKVFAPGADEICRDAVERRVVSVAMENNPLVARIRNDDFAAVNGHVLGIADAVVAVRIMGDFVIIEGACI